MSSMCGADAVFLAINYQSLSFHPPQPSSPAAEASGPGHLFKVRVGQTGVLVLRGDTLRRENARTFHEQESHKMGLFEQTVAEPQNYLSAQYSQILAQ